MIGTIRTINVQRAWFCLDSAQVSVGVLTMSPMARTVGATYMTTKMTSLVRNTTTP